MASAPSNMAPKMKYLIALFFTFVLLSVGKKDDKEEEKDECRICKDFVESFNKVGSLPDEC